MIMRTCLTLAAIQSVSGDVSLLLCKEAMFRVKLTIPVKVTSNQALGDGWYPSSSDENISPFHQLKNRHWTSAGGDICRNSSSGDNSRTISPPETTFNAAREMQVVVTMSPQREMLALSPKVANATPMTTGMTAFMRWGDVYRPYKIFPNKMDKAGTKLLII